MANKRCPNNTTELEASIALHVLKHNTCDSQDHSHKQQNPLWQKKRVLSKGVRKLPESSEGSAGFRPQNYEYTHCLWLKHPVNTIWPYDIQNWVPETLPTPTPKARAPWPVCFRETGPQGCPRCHPKLTCEVPFGRGQARCLNPSFQVVGEGVSALSWEGRMQCGESGRKGI